MSHGVRDERIGVGWRQTCPTGSGGHRAARPRSVRCMASWSVRIVLAATAWSVTRIIARLDDRCVSRMPVEIGRIEVAHPVPERDVRRCRLLRLERHDPANGFDRASGSRSRSIAAGVSRGSAGERWSHLERLGVERGLRGDPEPARLVQPERPGGVLSSRRPGLLQSFPLRGAP